MAGYLSALASKFSWSRTEPSNNPTTPNATEKDKTSEKINETAQKSIFSPGYWFPSWDSAASDSFANKKEALAAQILLSPFPQKFTSLNALFTLLTQILSQKETDGGTDHEGIDKARELLQELGPNVLNNTFAELFNNENIGLEDQKRITRAFKHLSTILDELESNKTLSVEELEKDEKFQIAFKAMRNTVAFVNGSWNEALNYLQTVFQPYIDKNENVAKAYELIADKLKEQETHFTYEETSVVAKAVKHLSRKECPQDGFLKTLDNFLRIHSNTLCKEASKALWNLNEELKLLPDNAKIAEKLTAVAKGGSFLPKEAAAYFDLLQTEESFERIQNKQQQFLELTKIKDQLANFAQSKEGCLNQHRLFVALQKTSQFLLNPEISPLASVEEEAEEEPDLQEESPTMWGKMNSIWGMLSGKKDPSAPKEPSTIDKVGAIVDKAHAITDKLANLTNSEFVEEQKKQLEGVLQQIADKASHRADPDLEGAGHALHQLQRALEIPSMSAVPKRAKSALEAVNTLNSKKDTIFSKEALEKYETGILDALVLALSQRVLPNRNQLLSIVRQAKSLIDKEINLQLGYGPKIARSTMDETDRALNKALDEIDLRIEKFLTPIYNALGLNPDAEENTFASYTQVVEAAAALQRLLEKDPSSENAQTALDRLTQLISSPQAAIQREWSETERVALTNLHTSLQDACAMQPLALSEALKKQLKETLEQTLSPFTTAPLSKMLGSLSDTLSQLVTLSVTKAGSALAKSMGSQVALGARVLLEASKGQLKADEKYKPIIKAIDQALPLIEAAEKSGEFNTLANIVDGCLKQLKGLPPIYIDKIPFFFGNKTTRSFHAVSPYANGIAKDKIALNEQQRSNLNKVDRAAFIELQKKQFVQNTTDLLVLKGIYESICGIIPRDVRFYTKLMDAARNEGIGIDASSKILRKKFFDEIDKLYRDNRITILHKFFAKFAYIVMMPIVKILMGQFASEFIHYIREIIIKNDEEGFAKIQKNTIKNFNSYLGHLGDAYRAALTSPVKGSLEEKILGELQKPEYNQGYTWHELYKAVAVQASKQFFPKLKLTTLIDDWFKANKFAETSLIKSALNAAGSVLFLLVRMVLTPIQAIINRILVWQLKGYLIGNEIIENLLEKNLSSLSDNNDYIYAINTVICNQLQKIVEKMSNDYIEKGSPVLNQNVTHPQRKQLSILVMNMLQILAKSKCLSYDELESFMKKDSYIQKIHEAVDSFLLPQLVDSGVQLIKRTYDSIMNEEQLEEQLNEFLSVMNQAFKTNEVISDEKLHAKELEIKELTDKILKLTIEEAVNKKFDFSIENETKQINDFIGSLQTNISSFESTMREKMGTLIEKMDQKKYSDSIDLLGDMLFSSKKFKVNRSDELYRLRGGLDSNVKTVFDELSDSNSAHFEKMDEPLRKLLEMQKALVRGENVSENLSASSDLLNKIQTSLQNLKSWSEGDDFKPIQPIDFSITQSKLFTNFISETALSRVQGSVDGLIEFFKDPMNYRGVLHHLLFIPFVENESFTH
jgi:hypothetical protein